MNAEYEMKCRVSAINRGKQAGQHFCAEKLDLCHEAGESHLHSCLDLKQLSHVHKMTLFCSMFDSFVSIFQLYFN